MDKNTSALAVVAGARKLADALSYANGAAFCDALDSILRQLCIVVRPTERMTEEMERLRKDAEELATAVERAGPIHSELLARSIAPLRSKFMKRLDRIARQSNEAAPSPMAALLELSTREAGKAAGVA